MSSLGLEAHAESVMTRVAAEESRAREHVVVYLSGAHAYGFPSPDSDLDLKAIHVAPTASMLGLTPLAPTHDRMEWVEGVEIDYTSNELGHALSGILRGNGNFIERVLGRTMALRGPLLEPLRPLVQRSLSRRAAHHYRGFAQGQRIEMQKTPTVKKLLYVLRTTLTGIHLMETGELITDVRETAPAHRIASIETLIERKQAGEKTPLPERDAEAWQSRIATLFEMLETARDRSPLPEEPANAAEIEAWLIETRRSRL